MKLMKQVGKFQNKQEAEIFFNVLVQSLKAANENLASKLEIENPQINNIELYQIPKDYNNNVNHRKEIYEQYQNEIKEVIARNQQYSQNGVIDPTYCTFLQSKYNQQ